MNHPIPTSDSDIYYFYRVKGPGGVFSQWYPSPITEKLPSGEEVTYSCAEQYMMHQKALLFAPSDPIVAKILNTTSPSAQKSLGRKIPNFSAGVWNSRKFPIVRRGNLLKFQQNEDLKEWLLATEEKYIVEASPTDNVWGIGMSEANAKKLGVKGREQWGENLLGKALMEVRDEIRAAMAEEVKEEAVDAEC